MFAIRLFISLSAALILVGCGGTRPDSIETANSAGSHEPDLVGIATAKPRETPETLQEKKTKLEVQLKLAQEFAGRGELDRAIQLLEEAVTIDARHRTVLLLLTQYLQTRSKALATLDPGRAYGLMVQSGGYLRALRNAHQDFSAEEREIIANVLFDEACAHARSNRQEETSGALSAAIEAGFDDLERLNSEPDFDHFRKVPAMANLLAEAASTVESRATELARNLLATSRTSGFEVSRLGELGPPIDFTAFQGKVLVLVIGNPQDARQQRIRDQLMRVKLRQPFPELEIKHLDLEEKSLKSLPGAPNPPAILFIDRAGNVRLVISGSQRSALLEAIARELTDSSS